MRILFFLFIISFSIKLNGQVNSKTIDTIHIYTEKYNKLKDSLTKPIDVSLEKLLKNPKKYNRKYIRVSGFLHIDLPYSLLYISKESYTNGDKSNTVIFMLHKEDCYVISEKHNNLIVIVSGVFNVYNKQKLIYSIQKVDAVE
jgi:hypothetical protein